MFPYKEEVTANAKNPGLSACVVAGGNAAIIKALAICHSWVPPGPASSTPVGARWGREEGEIVRNGARG